MKGFYDVDERGLITVFMVDEKYMFALRCCSIYFGFQKFTSLKCDGLFLGLCLPSSMFLFFLIQMDIR